MNTILVPTDFSACADNAMMYAIQFAQAYKMEIMLLHIVQPSTVDFSNTMYIGSVAPFIEEVEKKMKSKVEALQKEYSDIPFHTKVELGFFLDSLKNNCDEINPVFVAMGISGSGSAFQKLIGSNAIIAMNTLHHPLLIVPQNTSFKPIHELCLACDFKNVSATFPLLSVKAFSHLLVAKIHVLNIDFENKNFSPSTPDEIAAFNDMMDGIDFESHFVENKNVEDAIDDFIEKNKMDMLVMLPKKHSFLDTLLHKKHVKEMAYHTHIPMLVLRIN